MSNQLFSKGREGFADGSIDWDTNTVKIRMVDPASTAVDHVYGVDGAVTKISTGVYRYRFVPDQAGTWTYKWKGSGAVTTTNAIGESEIQVTTPTVSG